ncbi:MAG: hypothetical protein EOP24_26850 [Hyphomicrobiales bacterium]|nr:MAG: hypothetical protein EOP24_26850 [Hyphomicrobiales bacterium]
MSEKTPKDRDVIMGLIWMASPEGQQAARDLRRGTLRVSADPEHPEDPERAILTLPDETVVHGRLSETGEFIPDKASDAGDEAGR